MLSIRRSPLAVLAIAVLAQLATVAVAQPSYPVKPLRILVGFVPGGFTDTSARIVGQKLGDALGQQVIIENRPGANGLIAGDLASKSAPDGYTLFMTSPGLTTNPILYTRLRHDPVKDFTAISIVAEIPNVLVVHPAVPARSIGELFALARSKPGTLTQSSAGIGSPGHLSGELLQIMKKMKFVHVPYKGAQSVIDLIGGHVDLSFPSISSSIVFIKDGKLRALGVTSAKRSPLLPDVPSLGEKEVPGYASVGWYGIVGPVGIPKPVVTTLNREIVRILQNAEVRERLAREGAVPVINSPEEFSAFIANDHRKWAKVIKAANIRVSE
ncbi:MAG: tripartite tricarboxylate transporter substrate binding protein [Betaproteobacteria bacterium]|nr:tripartite tricarboxylate transporter substrate binding protein [Betaproteobacteria bacterium]